jgi:hypothetical protein
MSSKERGLHWLVVPITFAFGSLLLDATIVFTDYVAKGRIAFASSSESAPLPDPCRPDAGADCSLP